MLALLAAVSVAAAPAPKVAMFGAHQTPLTAILVERPRFSHLRSPVCRAAGRLETAYEPALLYRDQDRDAGKLRKLIELPDAQACLLGGTATSSGEPGEGR